MTPQNAILNDERYVPVYGEGFVGLVEYMGDDSTPAVRARVSYGKGTKSVSDDRNLVRYLVRHRHTSPLEMVELVFHLKMPIFVMRQHVRHRTASLNEYSGRYSEMSNEFYTPNFEDIQLQSTSNNQGREEDPDLIEFQDKIECQTLWGKIFENAYETYQKLLDKGVARELARIGLPVANYTECYWKIDLHNFFHYSKLRLDKHAQKEIRMLAEAMYELVKEKFPVLCEAFEDYQLNAVTFSRMEINLLRVLLRDGNEFQEWVSEFEGGEERVLEKFGLSKRELDEFRLKLI